MAYYQVTPGAIRNHEVVVLHTRILLLSDYEA